MAIRELMGYGPIGFKLAEAAWCVVGSVFVSNWRMGYWNLPVFALLVTNTFGYALISILLIFISLTEKPRYFVSVIFTLTGLLLNILAATLMLLRIFLIRDEDLLESRQPYHYTSEGLLAFWMSLCAITMLFDLICNSPPRVIETHSSTEDEDEDYDGPRRESRYEETERNA